MSLHLTDEEVADLPAWEDTPHGRSAAAAALIADDLAPFLMERVLRIVHHAGVASFHRSAFIPMREDPVFTALAPVLDPLLACASSASMESAYKADGTIGLDGSAVIGAVISTIAARLRLPDGHPALHPETNGFDQSRLHCFIEYVSDINHTYEAPWSGPHPLTDRVDAERITVTPDEAIDLARQAVADLSRRLA